MYTSVKSESDFAMGITGFRIEVSQKPDGSISKYKVTSTSSLVATLNFENSTKIALV